jgi:zeaxanthin glucosyltransferase
MPAERQSWHFGVLSFTGTGHLNPFILLSQELRQRGHKVTFFEKPKIEDRVRQAGFDFIPIGRSNSSSKNQEAPASNSSLRSGLSMLRFNLKRITHDLETYLKETPPALRRAGVDALIINEIVLSGPTIAEMLRLPYILISAAAPHSFGWNGYRWFSGYRYSKSWLSMLETALFEVSALRMRGPIRRALDDYRRQAGLGTLRQARRLFPELAHIAQLPQCLDLPRGPLPSNFHYTGPFTNGTKRPYVEFRWDRLDGRPILYASLGTTRNVQAFVLRLIAEACQDLNLQLIISLGGRFDPELLADLPGNPLVTRYAPQLELLKLATIVITHGGSNTVFEALLEGKPMIAIPLAYDQPAVAARLARLHLAEVLPVMRLSAKKIRMAVTKVLNDPRYREEAAKMQAKLQSLHGLERAADVIEEALEKQAARPLRGQVVDHHRGPERSAAVSIAHR